MRDLFEFFETENEFLFKIFKIFIISSSTKIIKIFSVVKYFDNKEVYKVICTLDL